MYVHMCDPLFLMTCFYYTGWVTSSAGHSGECCTEDTVKDCTSFTQEVIVCVMVKTLLTDFLNEAHNAIRLVMYNSYSHTEFVYLKKQKNLITNHTG